MCLTIKGLKAVITVNSLISGGLDNDRIVYFIFFVEKYSKFIDNIRSGNFIDTFCQKYRQIPKKSPPNPLCGAPLHWLYFTQCLTSFFSIDHLSCIYAWFLILFHLTQVRFSQSTHLVMCCCCFCNWDSLHARLNSHYEPWSYKKRSTRKYYRIHFCICFERTYS